MTLHHVRTSILLLPNPGGELQSARGEVDWQLKTEEGGEISIREKVGLFGWYVAKDDAKPALVSQFVATIVGLLDELGEKSGDVFDNKDELASKLTKALPVLLNKAVSCYIE